MASSKPHESRRDTLSGCLVRFFWMGAGNGALAFLALSIAYQEGFSLGLRDVAYWALVAILAGVRWVDISVLAGETVDGDPATLDDWRRYVIRLVAISLGLWLAAHVAGRLGVFD